MAEQLTPASDLSGAKLQYAAAAVDIGCAPKHAESETLAPLSAYHHQPSETRRIALGSATTPSGRTLSIDRLSLRLDGRRLVPVMGEIHYARYPQSEWRDALLRMKAGGVTLVATYVFWIHHEEIEGQFDFSGRRNLRKFVSLCNDLGLCAMVRLGPWCHGECRNGGFPDWLQHSGWPLRGGDPRYLAKVALLYSQIARQLDGLLWKDGGPVIGVQLENEYTGPAAHLLELKRLAREVGIDVPLYTYTGWLAPRDPVPFGQLLPLFGAYAEGFWDRTIEPMPGEYWRNFTFCAERTDNTIANDQVAARDGAEVLGMDHYPYLTCEVGGGMPCSYHRRILTSPADVMAIVLCRLGSGGNLPGYYMYHGGTNPEGKLSSMQESQATGYWNDLPEKSYDFLAPLGEFGQVREHYHSLRRVHLFLNDFGCEMAGMPATFPGGRPRHPRDGGTLRWSLRTDRRSAYLFVNNYQRALPMPLRQDVQFLVKLLSGTWNIPQKPTTIPADVSFFWPINLALSDDGSIRLLYATAQPVCQLTEGQVKTVVFAQIPGIASEFVLAAEGAVLESASGEVTAAEDHITVTNVPPGTSAALCLRGAGGERILIVLLSEQDSMRCYKGVFAGRERLLLSDAPVIFDAGAVRVSLCKDASILVLPGVPSVLAGETQTDGIGEGLFRRYDIPLPRKFAHITANASLIRPAAAASPVRIGPAGVAQAPTEADFESAAVWQIRLSAVRGSSFRGPNPLLRICYVGDVARLYLGERLIADNFYNGMPFDLGLGRFGHELCRQPLLLKVLPLRKDAPILLPASNVPAFDGSGQVASLTGISIVDQLDVALRG